MSDQGAEGLFSPYLRKQRIKAAKDFILGNVLDVGCGIGEVANLVSADYYFGVDIDDDSLMIARQRHPEHCFQYALPPTNMFFDTIIVLAVIEHVSDPYVFFNQLVARLKRTVTSRIIISTPFPGLHWLHTIGAKLGLFSRHANDEHKFMLNRDQLLCLANKFDLKIISYKKFLFGANQLVVLQRVSL